MKNTWALANVVVYDGVDAFVHKFVVRLENGTVEVDTDSMERLEQYVRLSGNVLKVDVLYEVSLDNIVAFKNADQADLNAVYERFERMYF